MDSFITFLGRFHPLVVHLPIGILMLAFLMEIASRWEQFKQLDAAIPFALLLGSLGATMAAILGYLLSFSGDYDVDTLWWHQWLGIGVAVLGFGCYFFKIKSKKNTALVSQSLLMLVLTFAGHNGGNLTHGATYLTEYAPWTKKKEKLPPPTSVDSAFVFQHLVEPILEKKCVSCHNAGKLKGELRMDSPEHLLKGGKHGKILAAGNLEESEIYRRVTLPQEEEEFMPPDGKTPLTENEVAILAWWIENTEHTFEKRVADVETPKALNAVFSKKLNIGKSSQSLVSAPSISMSQLDKLSQVGFTVRSLAGNYQMVDVTMKRLPKNTEASNPERLKMLQEIGPQIVWLNLSNQNIEDSDLEFLAKLENLQKLRLDNNPISDLGIQSLTPLKNLEMLNLHHTQITPNALSSLSNFQNLEKIYLWKTNINESNISSFQAENPSKQLIFGVTK